MLAELLHRLTHEQDQLGDHFLARRPIVFTVDHLAERPRVALRAATDHHRARPGRREHRLRPRVRRDVAGRDDRHLDERDELRRQTVIRRAGVHCCAERG